MKILLIEDDVSIAAFIKKGLKESGHTVDYTMNGNEGLELAMTHTYDAGIFDLMLPGMDGLSIIGKLRENQINFPILILSALKTVDDRIKGLKAGGDDYLTKPFSFSELVLRIEKLHERSSNKKVSEELVFEDLKLSRLSREVFRGDQKIDLQPREFALLELMLKNQGMVLSKTLILDQIWDFQFDPQTNVVDVLVSRLRSRIDKNFEEKYIHTIRGVGYVLKKENP